MFIGITGPKTTEQPEHVSGSRPIQPSDKVAAGEDGFVMSARFLPKCILGG